MGSCIRKPHQEKIPVRTVGSFCPYYTPCKDTPMSALNKSLCLLCACQTHPCGKQGDYSQVPRGHVIYSPRATPSVNESRIPLLSKNNPYLFPTLEKQVLRSVQISNAFRHNSVTKCYTEARFCSVRYVDTPLSDNLIFSIFSS